MKKVLIIGILFSMAFAGCKKEEKQDPIMGKWNYTTYAYIDEYYSSRVIFENPQEEGYTMYFVFNEDKSYYLINTKNNLTAVVGTYDIYDNILMLTHSSSFSSTTIAYTFHITDNTMELSYQSKGSTATSILQKE